MRPFVGREDVRSDIFRAASLLNVSPLSPAPVKRVVSGLPGMGKSRLVESVRDELRVTHPQTFVAHIDCKYGSRPSDFLELLDLLATRIELDTGRRFDSFRDLQSQYSAFQTQVDKMDTEAEQQSEDVGSASRAKVLGESLRQGGELLLPGVADSPLGPIYRSLIDSFAQSASRRTLDVQRSMTERLFKKKAISAEQAALLHSPGQFHARFLAHELQTLSNERPLVILIDTCEVLGPLVFELATQLISGLTAAPILWILAGKQLDKRDPLDESPGWLGALSTSNLQFHELSPLSREEVVKLVAGRLPDLTSDERARIAQACFQETFGVPIWAQAALDTETWVDLRRANRQDPSLDFAAVVSSFASRLLGDVPSNDLTVLAAMAMTNFSLHDGCLVEVLAPLCALNDESLRRIEKSYSIISNGILHELAASVIRQLFIQEIRHEQVRSELGSSFRAQTVNRIEAYLSAARQSVSTLNEPKLQDLLVAYSTAALWSSPEEGANTVVALAAASLVTRDRLSAKLIKSCLPHYKHFRSSQRDLLRTTSMLCMPEVALQKPQLWWFELPSAPQAAQRFVDQCSSARAGDPTSTAAQIIFAWLGMAALKPHLDVLTLLNRLNDTPIVLRWLLELAIGDTVILGARVTVHAEHLAEADAKALLPRLSKAMALRQDAPGAMALLIKVATAAAEYGNVQEMARAYLSSPPPGAADYKDVLSILWRTSQDSKEVSAALSAYLFSNADPSGTMHFAASWYSLASANFAAALEWMQRSIQKRSGKGEDPNYSPVVDMLQAFCDQGAIPSRPTDNPLMTNPTQ